MVVQIEIIIPKKKTCASSGAKKNPEILWEKKVGLGYSSVIEVDGFVTPKAMQTSIIPSTVWMLKRVNRRTFQYSSSLGDKYFQGGSRSTPTVAHGKIFLQGLARGPFFVWTQSRARLSGRFIWLKILGTLSDLGLCRSSSS